MAWSESDIPDLAGRIFVVTGANSGIGWEASRMFAEHGARVVMGCRTVARGEEAAARIRSNTPGAKLEVMALDLADLDSVRAFAAAFKAMHPKLDGLINNAGIMAVPYGRTAQGFELQLGTNHFGHFALTGLLFDALVADGRVVTVSSGAHHFGSFDWSDLNWEQGYSAWPAYGRSKLANLYFAFELDRRLKVAGSGVRSLACHPGYASTNLQFVAPQQNRSWLGSAVFSVGNALFAQPAAWGALPTVFAVVSQDISGGEYVGPRVFQAWGAPVVQATGAHARDPKGWAALWEASETRTGVTFMGAAA
ncbi:MAG: SDR family NAD(P)-dependent oxidoreductase [Myxococcales bacterium]|nr:SDR family NAD(P)-dependent oxidoreductase [Myxococcales bacterium]